MEKRGKDQPSAATCLNLTQPSTCSKFQPLTLTPRRESSLLTTYWSVSTPLSRRLQWTGLAPWSLNLLFQVALHLPSNLQNLGGEARQGAASGGRRRRGGLHFRNIHGLSLSPALSRSTNNIDYVRTVDLIHRTLCPRYPRSLSHSQSTQLHHFCRTVDFIDRTLCPKYQRALFLPIDPIT